MTRRGVRCTGLALVLALVLAVGVALAQRGDRSRMDQLPNAPYDGRFTFVRIRYGGLEGGFRREAPWSHDYPRAEFNFTRILAELSLARAYPGGNVLSLTDPELFKFPVAYIVEPGFWAPTDAEALALRTYLQKGGFLIVDDFAGNHWFNFEEQMRRVLPGSRLAQLDVSHPVFDSFFRIESLDHYHPYYPGFRSEFWGIFEDNDPAKRLMVIVNYNNDIAEYWEWSDQDFAPIELTNEAYKLGINYVIYAMTH